MRQSWNPLLEAMRRRLEEDVLPGVRAQVKSPGPIRRMILVVPYRVKRLWADIVLWSLAVGPFTAGMTLLATSRPWTAGDGSPDYSAVVVTAATATAFGGVLFSLVAQPLQTATQFAAGYSAELLQRPTLWLTGAWLTVLAIVLFLLAASSPDRETAIASGLLTGSSLGLVWLSARRLLSSGDPQEVAQRVSKFIRAGERDARRFTRRAWRQMLPKHLRGDPAGDLLVRSEERHIVNGFLRHFRAGIEGALAHRQPVAAIVLWEGAVATFSDYATEVGGDIGSSQGIMDTLLSTADEMVTQGLALQLDDVALQAIGAIGKLNRVDVAHDSYAAMRSVSLIKLKSWINSGWSDDKTRAPASAVSEVTALMRRSTEINAHEDALQALSALYDIATQAIRDRRQHISRTATNGIVSGLGIFLAADDSIRTHLVEMWAHEARRLSAMRMAEANITFMRATAVVFPGASVGERGIQETLAELSRYAHLSAAVVKPLNAWIRGALRDFASHQVHLQYLAVEGLTLLYSLAITQAHAVAADQPGREEQARLLLDSALQWAASIPDDQVGDVLLDPDAAEVYWSVLLAVTFTAQDATLLSEAATMVLDRLSERIDVGTPVHDGFSAEFVAGLMIAAGRSDQEIQTAMTQLLQSDQWWTTERGIHIQGFGRAPALNRNRIAVAQYEIYDVVNAWIAESFPRFVA